MKIFLVLICTVIVLTGCLPFKAAEVFPTVVANDTVVPVPTPVYTLPVQPYVPPVVEQVKPPAVNPYLKAENYTDISSWFTARNVPRTWWIPRYDPPVVTESVTIFWTGTAIVEVTN
jgi:hypothetical protein